MVVYMDVMTAAMLVFHAGFLFRIPYLGERLLSLAEDGQFMLKLHPCEDDLEHRCSWTLAAGSD